MIVGFKGPIGSGKSTLLTYMMLQDAQQGKLCFSNYPINGERYGVKIYFVPVATFLEMMKEKRIQFPLHTATYAVDEAYMYAESRTPKSKQVLNFGYFILQSRKTGCDVYHAVQLQSSIDKRLRETSTHWIFSELVGTEKEPEGFIYEVRNKEGKPLHKFMLTIEMAQKYVFGTFNTQELFWENDQFKADELDLFRNILEELQQRKKVIYEQQPQVVAR
jgi:ABC-type sugar transport system ATPase subunit